MERGQFTFYRSYYEAIRTLSAKDREKLIMAICEYALDEKEPELSGAAAACFVLVRPTLDVGRRKSENRTGTNQKQTKNKTKTNEEQTRKEKEKEKEKEGEKEKEKERERECDSTPPTPSPTKHKHGEYGRVLLTDEQYAKLLGDLGEAELERCIAYVDESAQRTGNKNGWKDWELVIRKCHREGWGMRETQRERSSNPFLDMLREEGAI